MIFHILKKCTVAKGCKFSLFALKFIGVNNTTTTTTTTTTNNNNNNTNYYYYYYYYYYYCKRAPRRCVENKVGDGRIPKDSSRPLLYCLQFGLWLGLHSDSHTRSPTQPLDVTYEREGKLALLRLPVYLYHSRYAYHMNSSYQQLTQQSLHPHTVCNISETEIVGSTAKSELVTGTSVH
jgi:hypothetical protein